MNQPVAHPCPLSIAFSNWLDLEPPRLNNLVAFSVPIDPTKFPNNQLWSKSNTTSGLFIGSKHGDITVYAIESEKGEFKASRPLGIVLGHRSPIVSMTECSNQIFDRCIACMFKNGSVSVISIADLAVIHESKYLFSENSTCIAHHASDTNIFLAARQEFIEVANIQKNRLIAKLSGFISPISSISTHRQIHCISCTDGSIYLMSIFEETASILYRISPLMKSDSQVSLISPNLNFMIAYSENSLSYAVPSGSVRSEELGTNNNIVKVGFHQNDQMYILTSSGETCIYAVENLKDTIYSTLPGEPAIVVVEYGDNFKSEIFESKEIPIPTMETAPLNMLSKYSAPNTCVVTPEGFSVSLESDDITLYTKNCSFKLSIDSYFKGSIRCRTLLPNKSEVVLTKNGDVYVDNVLIGNHSDAVMLFSPKKGTRFLSLGRKGSVHIWGKTMLSVLRDLTKPISSVIWLPDISCAAVLDTYNSFSLVDIEAAASIALCSGHDSPVQHVTVSRGLILATTQSGKIYTWTVFGALSSVVLTTPRISTFEVNPKNTKPIKQRGYKLIDVVLGGCQTYAMYLDSSNFGEDPYTKASPIISGYGGNITLPFIQSRDITPLSSTSHAVATFVIASNMANSNGASGTQEIIALSFSLSRKSSLPVLAQWLTNSSSAIRSAVLQTAATYLSDLPPTTSLEAVQSIEYKFSNWDCVVPLTLLIIPRTPLPPQMYNSIVKHLFPVIVEHVELLDFLQPAFPALLPYIHDLDLFFRTLIQKVSSGAISENKIAGLGIHSPLEYLDAIRNIKGGERLIKSLFERMISPNPRILHDFLILCIDADRGPRDVRPIDYDVVYKLLNGRFGIADACHDYVVHGSQNGTFSVFSRETGGLVYTETIFESAIVFVSVSPGGTKCVAVSVLEGQMAWFSRDTKAHDLTLSFVGKGPIQCGNLPMSAVWSKEGYVKITSLGKKVYEGYPPGTSLINRLF